MRIRYVGLAFGLALLNCVDQGIAAPPPPPAAVFAALPAIRNVALSPGGKMLAWFDSTSGAEEGAESHAGRTYRPAERPPVSRIRSRATPGK